MLLKLKQKKAIVAEMRELADKSVSLVAVNYRGLTVPQMTVLRQNARKSDLCLRVVRNTLARRAFEGTKLDCLHKNKLLTGPILFVFSLQELGAGARVICDFMKDHEALTVVGLVLMDKLLSPNDLKKVAKLPSKEEAMASLLAVMKAPIVRLVRLSNELNARLVRTVAAIAEKKGKA